MEPIDEQTTASSEPDVAQNSLDALGCMPGNPGGSPSCQQEAYEKARWIWARRTDANNATSGSQVSMVRATKGQRRSPPRPEAYDQNPRPPVNASYVEGSQSVRSLEPVGSPWAPGIRSCDAVLKKAVKLP